MPLQVADLVADDRGGEVQRKCCQRKTLQPRSSLEGAQPHLYWTNPMAVHFVQVKVSNLMRSEPEFLE